MNLCSRVESEALWSDNKAKQARDAEMMRVRNEDRCLSPSIKQVIGKRIRVRVTMHVFGKDVEHPAIFRNNLIV